MCLYYIMLGYVSNSHQKAVMSGPGEAPQPIALQLNPFSTLQKAHNMELETSPRPYDCNYNFMCTISVHVQTLKEYSDAKNTSEYQNNEAPLVHDLAAVA